ncbi:MAG: hypothetical protein ACLRIO_04050 [Butyricicoccus sp.]
MNGNKSYYILPHIWAFSVLHQPYTEWLHNRVMRFMRQLAASSVHCAVSADILLLFEKHVLAAQLAAVLQPAPAAA